MTTEVPRFAAQLASTTSKKPEGFDRVHFVAEEKFDGIRALVAIEGDSITIRNRHGQNKGRTEKNDWLVERIQHVVSKRPLLKQGTILDGELVADTWNQTMHELAHGGDGLRFVVFDLPYLAGYERWDVTLANRQFDLYEISEHFPDERVWLSEQFTPSSERLDAVYAKGGEGLIIKDLRSPYLPGGRNNWFKIKKQETADGVIMGFTEGRGKYKSTVGAVVIGQVMPDGQLHRVTQISGMTDEIRNSLGYEHVGQVVEFEFQQKTKDSYRHPRWVHLRPDKLPEECTW